MISTELRFTYMQRVRPDMLGSHLEAYIKLLPTFNAMRLCARYGKGDAAFVNRLPAELVKQIEDVLTADEHYDNDIPMWGCPSLCFFGVCEPIDHLYSDKDLVHLYAHYVQGTEIDDAAASSAKLNVDEQMDLNEAMMESNDFDGQVFPGIKSWQNVHRDLRSQWTYLTGEVGSPRSGLVHTFQSFFRQHFGLDLSVSHKTLEKKWYDEDFTSDTEAFIMLPSVQTVQQLPARLAGEEITARLPTEHTENFCIEPPPQPSDKSMARFARCLKILQLEPLPFFGRRDFVKDYKKTPKDDNAESREESSDDSDCASSSSEGDEVDRDIGPALRLLVVNRDDTPYDVMD